MERKSWRYCTWLRFGTPRDEGSTVEMNVWTFRGVEGLAGDLCGLLKPPSVLSPPSNGRASLVGEQQQRHQQAKVESVTAAYVPSQGEKWSTLIKEVRACVLVYVRTCVGKNAQGRDVHAIVRSHRGITPRTHVWHLNVFT